MKTKPCCVAFLVVAFAALAVGTARAQMLSPIDDAQKARFDAVTQAVARAGYANPGVVGVSDDKTAALFTLLATHAGKNVLVAVVEPNDKAAAHPLDLESDKEPAALGVRTVRFEPFLDTADLVDVIVSHEPFRLEMGQRFDQHHVLRRKGGILTAVCEFRGDSVAGYAKGPRSVSNTRKVTIEKVADATPPAFDVKTVDETIESSNIKSAAAAPTTQRSESTVRYVLTASGSYEPEKK